MHESDPLFDEALSYRFYRLQDTSQSRSSRATGKVKDLVKRIEIKMWNHRFDGDDPSSIIDFLKRFVKEADIQLMLEAQAYLALPSFLDGVALTHYQATCESLDADEGGVTCWPEAVNYLLRSFATSNAISEAVRALREIRQRPNETETSFAKRLNEAHIQCGKVQSADAIVQFFLRGLDPAIRTIVKSYREGHRRSRCCLSSSTRKPKVTHTVRG